MNLLCYITVSQKKKLKQEWTDLIAQVEANLDKDPSSDVGRGSGKQCMDLVNNWYGKEHAALRTSIWKKGYKEGKMEEEHGISPQSMDWLDRAVSDYYRQRAYYPSVIRNAAV